MIGRMRETERPLSWRRSSGVRWVALVAAYMLAAQTLLVGLTSGLHAAPRSFGGAGLVLCTAEGLNSLPADDDQRTTRRLPDCCLSAGGLLALAAPPVAAHGLAAPPFAEHGAPAFRAHQDRPVPSRDGSLGNPRAPPLTT